jgi:hypothetical protein
VGNDPYRSLAWLVRENGGYKETEVVFADFQWAQFFRKRNILKCHFRTDIVGALSKAMNVARASQTKNLPGHINIKK